MPRLSLPHLWIAGTALGLGLGLAACEYREPDRKRLGYEVYDQYCNDGLDNDGDGLVDCDDPECPFTSAWCGEALGLIPPVVERENDIFLCRDRVDNDGNGQFDCGDDKCQAIPETCCLREFSDALCSDGLDNDGNGFADCADFGCSRGIYVTVCGRTEVVPPLSPEEACFDGFDGDGDGLVDCEDPDCIGVVSGDRSCPTQPEDSLELCTNGRDDDGDGDRDCADPDCQSVERICLPDGAESTPELCFDGIDNDGNGFTDCDDFGCSRSGPPEVVERCGGGGTGEAEDDLETCFDGIDNDGNGFTDCNDFSCSRSGPVEVREACLEAGERSFEKCNDGIDNDGNGFTDCEDFSCTPDAGDAERVLRLDDPDFRARSATFLIGAFLACDETGGTLSSELRQELAAATSSAGGPPQLRFPTPDELCSDDPGGDLEARLRADNDGDGFIDCDDWNCNWNPLVTVCPADGERRLCE